MNLVRRLRQTVMAVVAWLIWLSWLESFRRFQHVQDQWATVDCIKNAFAPDEKLGFIGADRELTYVSGK